MAGVLHRDVTALPRASAPTDWPINFVHRGGSGIGPENTIESFHIGLEAGGGVIETDVHTTVDGHVVVIHDPDTVRTTGERVRVSETTLAELQELNAAATFRHADTQEPWDDPPVRIPTLAGRAVGADSQATGAGRHVPKHPVPGGG